MTKIFFAHLADIRGEAKAAIAHLVDQVAAHPKTALVIVALVIANTIVWF